MSDNRCQRVDCPHVGIWYPLILLAHSSAPDRQATMCIDVRICDEHKRGTSLDDLVSDEQWPQLVRTFIDAGKAAPTRELTVLRWTRNPGLPREH